MFAGFCPNCGAPMKVENLGVCPYCGYDVVDDEMGEYSVCPVCGEYVEKDISGEFPDVCPVCGNSLKDDANENEDIGTSPGEEYVRESPMDVPAVEPEPAVQCNISYCPSCGSPIKEAKYCPYCGFDLSTYEEVKQPEEPVQQAATITQDETGTSDDGPGSFAKFMTGIIVFAFFVFIIATGIEFGAFWAFLVILILYFVFKYGFVKLGFVLLLFFLYMTYIAVTK